ncbi:hypothetical protein AMECASPLE_013513 [Ameca splendens]|uniref:Uncharacterized protein n=1 Tax=Ameca splendens TaxID=208324 RepID=A0ABV1A9B6_9TELE
MAATVISEFLSTKIHFIALSLPPNLFFFFLFQLNLCEMYFNNMMVNQQVGLTEGFIPDTTELTQRQSVKKPVPFQQAYGNIRCWVTDLLHRLNIKLYIIRF